MGLFSGSVTTIDSSTQLLVANTPNLVRDSILIATANNRSIADDILDNYLNGLAVKGMSMYNYGKNYYEYGLPNGSMSYAPVMDSVVRSVIQRELDSNILINFNLIDVCNPDYFAFPYMRTNHNWNSETNEVTPFFEIPEDIIIPDGTLAYFDRAEILAENQIRIYYTYGIMEPIEDITVTGMEPKKFYYHVGYYLTDNKGNATGDIQYWNYNISTGSNPTLDLPDQYVEDSPYYPIVPIRENKVDLTADKTTNLYKTSKQCLSFVKIKINEIAEGINASPNIGDIDHAYIMLGIDIQSEVQNSILYLHDYFTQLEAKSDIALQDYIYWEANQKGLSNPPTNTVTIMDANFKTELVYNYITSSLVTGSVGKIGFATRENVITDKATWYPPGTQDTSRSGFHYETSSIIFRKQVTSTQYEETVIKGIQHINYVYATDLVITSLADSLNTDNDKNNFIVPLNINVAKNMGTMKHNYIMYDAIRIVFNSKVVTKLKWYETGFFKFVMLIVMVVITIYSAGTLGGAMAAAYSGAGYAGISAGALALAAYLAVTIIEGIVLSAAIGYVVDHVGAKAGLVLAIVAMAISAYAPEMSFKVPMLPTSVSLMQITDCLFKAVQVELGEDIAKIGEDLDNLKEERADLTLLEDEFEGDLTIDPLELINVKYQADVYETPETFYDRTSHRGNIGVLSLDVISSYVTSRLKLKLPDSPIRTII